MELKKKLDENTVVSASYLPEGICLRITQKGDRYRNTVVSLAMISGKPQLTIFKNTIDHYGVKVKKDNIELTEW